MNGGNDFGWALRALKNGMHVTRIGWSDTPYGLLDGMELRLDVAGTGCIYKYPPKATRSYYTIDQQDALAEDWVLASDIEKPK